MDDDNNYHKTAIAVLASVLVVTGIACALIGAQGLLVALICLCAIECFTLLEEGLYDTAALIAAVALVAMLGLNPIVWLGGASVAVCIVVIVALYAGSR